MNIKPIFLFAFFFLSFNVMAQYPYIGIQNSQRKGIISAMMNPAEINNLHRNVEVQFFAVNGVFGNNTLTFSETLRYRNDLWNQIMLQANEPVNGKTDGSGSDSFLWNKKR
jgi:hypothetical protein